MYKKPHVLAIISGFGINERKEGNAIKIAGTPNIDKLMKQNPNTVIDTSGSELNIRARKSCCPRPCKDK